MKRALSIYLLIVIIYECSGQSLDSLKQRILIIENHQEDLRVNMDNFVEKHKEGSWLIIGGALFILGETLVSKHTLNKNPEFIYAGAGLIATGYVMQIHSLRLLRVPKRKLK